MKAFRMAAKENGKDIYVPAKTSVIGVFDFRAFLNMAMLLYESDKARALRQLMLDIVIDIINNKTGGGTKYINQRDHDVTYACVHRYVRFARTAGAIFPSIKNSVPLVCRAEFCYSERIVMYFCFRLVGLSGIVILSWPLASRGFKYFLVK